MGAAVGETWPPVTSVREKTTGVVHWASPEWIGSNNSYIPTHKPRQQLKVSANCHRSALVTIVKLSSKAGRSCLGRQVENCIVRQVEAIQ